MGDWRFLAQNVLTREWVSTDLPLSNVEVEREVSGPGAIRATIEPEVLGLRGSSGRLLEEWQTAIYAELDSRIFHGTLLTYSSLTEDGQSWRLEAPGFTTYPRGNVYYGDLTRWAADPFDLVRHVWDHLQSRPGGNLRMQVTSASSTARVGDVQPPSRPADVPKQTFKAPVKGPRPKNASAVAAWEADYKARRKAYTDGKAAYDRARQRRREEQQRWDELHREKRPYELHWWEAPDCGSEIDRLATESPFDYLERHSWDPARQDVLHRLDLGHPRLGGRRPHLRLAVGENVAVVPERERDGDDYYNALVGLGKGEGRDMLRVGINQTAAQNRLRRLGALPLKDVGNLSRLRALTEAELKHTTVLDDITEVVVYDHPNAPLGTFDVGDELLLLDETGTVPTRMWVRVQSLTIRPDTDDRVVLRVRNAEKG